MVKQTLVLVATSILVQSVALVVGLGVGGLSALDFLTLIGCGPHLAVSSTCHLWWSVAILVGSTVCGLIFGSMQWIILRYRRIAQGGTWPIISTFGWAIGLFLGITVYNASDDFAVRLVSASITGLVPSVAQWFVLKRHMAAAWWWILANTFSTTLIGLALRTESSGLALSLVVSSIIATSTTLALLARKPTS